jgi:hypothetical protein
MDESEKKLMSKFLSMELHVAYVRSLEDSNRVRAACLKYLQRRFLRFYPEHVALVKQLQQLAASLGGRLEIPQFPGKYSWIQKLFGWAAARTARRSYNRMKSAVARSYDAMLLCMESLGRRSKRVSRSTIKVA